VLARSSARPARRASQSPGLLLALLITLSSLSSVWAAWGCASERRLAYPPGLLRAEVARRAPSVPRREIVVPFEVSPEMVRRARGFASGQSDYHRALALAEALVDPDEFGLRYQPVVTEPAMATLERREGNCLSLTSVYVGLAREIGLRAHYLLARDRVVKLGEQEEFVVSSGHIAAAVRTEYGVTSIDLAGKITQYRSFRILDDLQALAHFYNNRGYEVIHRAQQESRPIPWKQVRRQFELATAVRPGFALAWNNLGITYARLGRTREAELRYRAAISQDPKLAAAHYNLGGIQRERGDLEEAVASYRRAAELDPRNAFHHYHLGAALHASGATEPALAALERAVELESEYAAPRRLLARIREGRPAPSP
jgi:tetratricopeptide (TPR) repeat protein